MVSFADEIDSNALVANPFLDLPILTAARAFLAEREFLAKPPANMTPMAVLLMREVRKPHSTATHSHFCVYLVE